MTTNHLPPSLVFILRQDFLNKPNLPLENFPLKRAANPFHLLPPNPQGEGLLHIEKGYVHCPFPKKRDSGIRGFCKMRATLFSNYMYLMPAKSIFLL
jgi:hypothetical protein